MFRRMNFATKSGLVIVIVAFLTIIHRAATDSPANTILGEVLFPGKIAGASFAAGFFVSDVAMTAFVVSVVVNSLIWIGLWSMTRAMARGFE
jgi:hypothetical protein